ncbi:MAG: YqiJ family protein [Sulfitobacter sp.]
MLTIFLAPESLLFSVSLAVVGGLFLLEILSALLGGTLLGIGSEGPDLDVDLDADFDLSADIANGIDLGLDDVAPDVDAANAPSGILTWIGARDVPFLIWLVSFLTMFGLFGLILQSGVHSVLGSPLPAVAAAAVVFMPTLGVTRVIANWVALLMPKTETTAMRMRHLGGQHGTVTQGTAARGKPAEVKIKDRHGNIHYMRVEPLHDADTFPQGSDVTLIRKRGDKFFVI